jgi:hypothetical protein
MTSTPKVRHRKRRPREPIVRRNHATIRSRRVRLDMLSLLCCWANDERASWLSAEERAVAKVFPGDECARRLERRESAHIVTRDVVSGRCLSREVSRCARRGLLRRSRRFGLTRDATRDQYDSIECFRRRRGWMRQNERQTGDKQSHRTHPMALPTVHYDQHSAAASTGNRRVLPRESILDKTKGRRREQRQRRFTRALIPSGSDSRPRT